MRPIWLVAAVVLLARPAFAQDASSDPNDSDSASHDVVFDDVTPHVAPVTPWYVPRSATLITVAGKAVTPQLRLGWEFAVIPERSDLLMLVAEAGGGWSLSADANPSTDGDPGLSWFREGTLLAGVGYRDVFNEDWAWGFKVVFGGAWVGARSAGLPNSTDLVGVVEGRGELGHYFGSLQVGFTAGIQSALNHSPREYASYGLGGLMVGIYANWR